MKKSFLSLALSLMAMTGFAQGGTLHIEAQSKLFGDTAYIYPQTPNWNPKVLIKKGKFSADRPLDNVQSISVATLRNDAADKYFMASVLGVPGETLKLTTQGDEMLVSGSAFYKEVGQIQQGMKAAGGKTADYLMNYVKEHPQSEAVVNFANQLDMDAMVALLDALSPEVQQGRMKTYINTARSYIKAQKEAMEKAKTVQGEGVEAQDFTLNDLDGKPFTLSSLRGKYVVLDFWGSWCGWCIKGFPEMKEYYAKYPGKFEIVGVDCNDTEEKWKKAVADNELPWIQVFLPKDGTVVSDYAVMGFPTKILIGPDGKIVKTYLGETPKFYEKLDELFAK